MITIRTANFTVEGSVEEILSLFRQLEFAPSIDPVEEPPVIIMERDQQQTSLTEYEPFKRRSSSQAGIQKPNYRSGRKIHCCSNCGEEHRRMDKETGYCKSCDPLSPTPTIGWSAQ